MEGIKHVFFDLDNTLWDFRKNSELALREMYRKHQVEEKYGVSFSVFHPIYYEKNEALWVEFRDKGIGKEELRRRRFIESFELADIPDKELAVKFEAIYFDEIIHYNHLLPGAEEVLSYLSKKYQVHVLTNGFKEVSQRKIESTIIKDYLTTWTSAEELNSRKPNPDVFLYALKKANARVEASIYIGDDWVADVLGAEKVGMKVLFFNSLKEAVSSGNRKVIEELTELLRLL